MALFMSLSVCLFVCLFVGSSPLSASA